MKPRKIGELEVSPVTLGTWAIGGWLWGGADRKESVDAIIASIDSGINCLDTAPMYGFGLSEEIVGEAIKDRRDKVIVATKCGMVWDDRPGSTHFFETTNFEGKRLWASRCLKKESILKECDESLKRLNIDVIDLYQCHWPHDETSAEETMEALTTLKEQGKIKEFGVSNFSVEQLKDFMQYGELASNQPKYSLLSRDIEDDVLPFSIENNIAALPYSPLEMGLLAGKITMDTKFKGDDTRTNRPWFQPEMRKKALNALEQIRPIAEKYDATLGQTAIAWTFAQPGIVSALVGARNIEQAQSNAKAAELSLAQEDIDKIRKVFTPLRLEEAFDPAKIKR